MRVCRVGGWLVEPMTVCELCWAVASERALLLGGSTVDHYRRILDESMTAGLPAWHTDEERQNAGRVIDDGSAD